jgi:excisionase family DNA binding protein
MQQDKLMTALPTTSLDPIAPTEAEAEQAKVSSRQLAVELPDALGFRLHIDNGSKKGQSLALPRAAVRLLFHVLTEMAQGNAVTLVPIHAELTTQEAAALLNVSRPFVVKLLDEGTIPSRKVGTHRRVLFEDVMAYKRDIDNKRLQALAELSALDQELGLGY